MANLSNCSDLNDNLINQQTTFQSDDYFKELGEKTRLILDAALDAIIGINTAGLITIWNPQAEQIFGWKKEEIIGQSLTEKIVPIRHRNKYDQGFKHYFQTDQQKVLNRKMEITAINRENQEFPIEISILPICEGGHEFFCAFIRDISERKKADQRIKESEERYKTLVQNGSDMIAIYNKDWTCKFMSTTITAILGYEPEYFYHHSSHDLLHPEDAEMVTKAYTYFTEGNKITMGPYRLRHKNGEWRWLESYVTNLLNDPVIQGIVINSHDITERILLQNELEKQTRQNQKEVTTAVINAQEKERSQLGQELHDNVNQVLTTVKLYNEMLLDGIGEPKEIIKKSVHHLQSCINEIRSISKRLSAPTLGNISLLDSIKELVESINLTKRINIVYTIEGFINQEISQEIHLAIYRIVQEQLNNIIKYAEASFATITIVRTKKDLALVIKDDGKGFDMDTKRKGIGITNMKTRAENLNGNFSVNSQPGQGCIVKVCIPL